MHGVYFDIIIWYKLRCSLEGSFLEIAIETAGEEQKEIKRVNPLKQEFCLRLPAGQTKEKRHLISADVFAPI